MLVKFTDTHEWIKVDNHNVATVGITDYAQNELGQIVYVELPEVGKTIKAGQEVVVLESSKAAADIYSPASGKIISINENVKKNPQEVNNSAEKNGWLFRIELTKPVELETLLDEISYKALITLE